MSLKFNVAGLVLVLWMVAFAGFASGQPDKCAGDSPHPTTPVAIADVNREVSGILSAHPTAMVFICVEQELAPIDRGLFRLDWRIRKIASVDYEVSGFDQTSASGISVVHVFQERRPPIGGWEVDDSFIPTLQLISASSTPREVINDVIGRMFVVSPDDVTVSIGAVYDS